MRNFWHFLQYHNAVPIALGIMVLGAGATFAATDPQAIYSAQQQVIAVDNTYIVNKDLSAYTPRAEITGVTEDAGNYYVAYKLYTIDLQDSVWQDVTKDETMNVSKADLGAYHDLGVYVTAQLRQNIDREIQRLTETQAIERKNVSQKVVATTYGGLVGKFLDATTETLPGYTPVVLPPQAPGPVAGAGGGQGGGETLASGGGGSSQIGIQVLGNNPAHLALHATYIDLGAVLLDPHRTNVGLHTYFNGVETLSPSVDTSTSTAYTIEYRATDPGGNTIVARRIVLVGDAVDPGGEINFAGTSAPAASESAPTPTSAPAPGTAQTNAPSTTSASATPPASDTAPPVNPPMATTSSETATTSASVRAVAATAQSVPPSASSTPDSATTTPAAAPSASSTSASAGTQ
jgi:hypothetical protein